MDFKKSKEKWRKGLGLGSGVLGLYKQTKIKAI